MRRSGRTMRRAVRTARRIRSIRRCRSQRRGRSMTTAQGRNARLPAVRGRRGRLAISLGDAWFGVAAAGYGCSTPSGALRDVAQRGRISRRCLLHLRDDQPARLNIDPRLAARNKTRIVDQPHSTNLHVRIKRLRPRIHGLRGTPHFLDRDETFRLRWSCFMIRLSHGQLLFSWLWLAGRECW